MFRLFRRPERRLTFIKAQMRVGEQWQEVTLANVSATGVMVRCAETPDVGCRVEIRHRGVTICGEVAWSTATRFGLKSPETIDLSALTAQSSLQLERRRAERVPPTNRRLRERWMFWNT